jgi:hypothetical protein
MIAVLFVYFGLLISLLGFVSILRPLGFLKSRTRLPAILLVIAGTVLTTAGFVFPANESHIATPQSRLDEFAPAYQFNEFHSLRVNASPERVYAAVKAVTADEILFFQTLTWIRRGGRPMPPSILNAPGHQPLLDVATRTSFLLLAEDSNREIVLGSAVLVPRGWRPTRQPTPEDFKSLHAPGFALASMNFLVEPSGVNESLVTTETRVYATDPAAAAKFARYWRVIYPGSALIRRMWLRAIKRHAEFDHERHG